MSIKVAIVGCGGIAQVHGDALKSMEGTEIVAVADIKLERAVEFSGKFGGKSYDNLNSMLDNEKIDVLHICTPHYLHVPMAIEALNRGINVLMEKPVATSEEQLNSLKIAVVKCKKTLGVCFQNRYLPSSQKAFQLIKSGEAGKVLGTRAIVTWKRDANYYTSSGWRGSLETECGGVMINQAIHTLDLMIWLTGVPVNVEGKINNHHLKGVIEVEDTAEIFLDFGNDVTGIFYASNANANDAPIMLDIWCEKMHILLLGDDLFVDGVLMKTEKLPVTIGKMCWGVGHKLLIADYYEKLKSGEEFPVSVYQAQHAINAIFELYKSSKE